MSFASPERSLRSLARSIGRASVLPLTLALFALSTHAQISTATITGTVRDGAGGVVPDATVVLQNAQTNVEARTASNGSGNYVLLNIPPGSYVLESSKTGFTTNRINTFTLVVNQTATFDFVLQVGTVQQSITVDAVGAQIQSASAELGTAVTRQQVLDLPVAGRNFQNLMRLTPGVVAVSTAQTSTPSVNGQPNRSSLFFMDGLTNQTYQSAYAIAPILDTIEEFKVQSHNDSAEFGGVLGGTINTVTKSGTNTIHGSAWEFIRNDAFNARNFFLPTVPVFRENTFGGTLGGPVMIPKLYSGRNKTFFFVGYQGYRYVTPANKYFRVPTAANLAGDLSDWPKAIYDPLTTRENPARPGTFIRDLFPGNKLPTSRLNAGMLTYAKTVLPAPITTGVADYNALDTTPIRNPSEEFSIRADHNFSDKDSVWFRYSASENPQTSSGGMASIEAKNTTSRYNVGSSWVHIFNPSTVLQVQFGRSSLWLDSTNLFRDLPSNFASQVGYSSNLIGPYVDGNTYYTGFSVNGFFSGSETRAHYQPGNTWQQRATLSKVHSNHTFKMGAEVNTVGWNYIAGSATVAFSNPQTADPLNLGTTGSPLASFLLGVPDSGSRINRTESLPWAGEIGFFFQDQWKVTPRLTVNLGLRYDRTFIPVVGKDADHNNEIGNMDLNRGVYVLQKMSRPCSEVKTAPCIPTVDGKLPDHVEVSPDGRTINDTTMNFQPRVGIAYRLSSKTAIRAAGGVFFDNWSAIIQAVRGKAGSWPSIGSVSPTNLNYPTLAQPTPSVPATDPLPSAVTPAATPFTQVVYFVDPNWKNAYSLQWNFGIQHEVNPSTVLSVNYVGSGTRRTDLGWRYNTALTPGPGAPSARYPFPYITPTNWDRSWGRSNYNALQVSFERRWANGLQYTVAYTYSKSIDLGASGYFGIAEGQSIQDPYHFNNDRSISDFDLTHNFVSSWVYQIPIGAGKALSTRNKVVDYVIGGWQFNGIANLQSGLPYHITAPGDIANTGNTSYMRANLVGDPHLSNPTPSRWINTAAFASPAAFTFGNSGRNILRSDWNRTFDLSLFREFPVYERFRLQLRGEAYNAFNTPIFKAAVKDISSINFGKVVAASDPRILQLSVKVTF